MSSVDIICKLSDVASLTGSTLAAPIDTEWTTSGLTSVVGWWVSGSRGDWSRLGLLRINIGVPVMEEAPGVLEPIYIHYKWEKEVVNLYPWQCEQLTLLSFLFVFLAILLFLLLCCNVHWTKCRIVFFSFFTQPNFIPSGKETVTWMHVNWMQVDVS